MSTAMFDATCSCGRRIGWSGKVTDRPPCPSCGRRPSDVDLERDAKHVDELFAMLATHPREASPRLIKQMRLFAGLGMRRAAEHLGIPPSRLLAIEGGTLPLTEDVAAKMAQLYSCGIT